MTKGDYDVIIIGGGPAGSSTACHLARQGLRVLVIEGKFFPRDHIGESLLAMSMPLLRELGVEQKLNSIGFIRKPGAVFIWGESGKELELGMPSPGHAFQVIRARFDQMLLEHAQEQGAQVLQGQWVRRLIQDGTGRVRGVGAETHTGKTYEIYSRFVVDGSGLTQFLPRRLNLPVHLEGPRRIALGAYFEGALRPDSPHENDIISEACQDGWIWFIPLNERLTSVGFVSDEYLINTQPSVALAQQIATSKLVKRLLVPATITRNVQVLRYTNHMVDAPFWNNGYVLTGDSAIFVDPLFSTGVHGALYTATQAAAGLTSFLAGTISEVEVARWYQQRVQKHYFRVNETVKLLYGIHPASSPFWSYRDRSHIGDDEGELTAQRLGASGMAFFANAMRAGVLNLPPPIAKRVPEFVYQVKPVPIQPSTVVRLAPEVKLLRDWMCHHGRLVPAISLAHARNRTVCAEFPADSFFAKLLQTLNGHYSLASAVQLVIEKDENVLNVNIQQKYQYFVGTLIQAGLLTHSI